MSSLFAEMMELCPNNILDQEELDTAETSRLTGRLSSEISISDSQVILIKLILYYTRIERLI